MALTGRQRVGMAIVVAAVGGVGWEFLAAAKGTIESGRLSACRALAPDPVPAALTGELPDFELPDANGKKWSLKALRGRPVLLNFWATWCAPCTEEMPSMNELAAQLGNDAVVLAVSVDEGWEPIKRFFAAGTSLSLVLDESKAVPKRWGTEKYPESFLIDSSGRVRHYFINKRKWDMPEAAECVRSVE